ncbi:hypothetical protein GY45DRAFT_1318505 [Cubamyces sp. BRFM 1775]|nr:hypothetical protein GY45DRAFT_1318505 [Cubamyces sp. BRFM 1775]
MVSELGFECTYTGVVWHVLRWLAFASGGLLRGCIIAALAAHCRRGKLAWMVQRREKPGTCRAEPGGFRRTVGLEGKPTPIARDSACEPAASGAKAATEGL